MINFKRFNEKEELVNELSENVIQILQESIDKNARATLLVSGGNTPKPFFQKLSKYDISWEKVTIALVDDRWVEKTHKDSNEHLVKENLIQNFASRAKFVGMYIDNKSAFECDKKSSLKYKNMLEVFDVLILGMGTDSHTASLFPNNEKLDKAFDLENKNLCISIKPENALHDRMSLTLAGILSAKNIILHIEGEEKLKVYEKALSNKDIYSSPISAVLNNKKKKDVEVYYS